VHRNRDRLDAFGHCIIVIDHQEYLLYDVDVVTRRSISYCIVFTASRDIAVANALSQ
jgi:hypothetical protein